MPCRTPRIAASASQTLWITDEILAEAFNRFLGVSHTHRRFGSNIPGPLEARRRNAKRRLGLSAVPSGGAPPVHDFGGLFGIGASRPPEFEKGWRWQAPLPAWRVSGEDVGVGGREEWKMPLFDGSFEQSVETGTEDARARVEKFFEIPEDPVETSTNAFAKLLEARRDLTTVEAEDLQPFIAFLESSSNEPDAELTHRLVQWLTERSTTKEAMDSLLSLLRQKMSLHTMNTGEQSDILRTLAQNDHLQAAYRLFIYSQNLSLSDHLDLPIKLIQTAPINTNKVWHLFDHRARESSGVPDARHIYPQRLPQDLTTLVQEAAYAWSRSPHLRARVAYRRVWECYRFLAENSVRLTPLMTRALVRAGIANFVRARMAIPRSRVRHLLKLVGRIEGHEVKREVDRLIFSYWLGTRNLSRYKPAGRAWREKWKGEQTLGDGSVRRVTWRGRVLRESVEVRMLREDQAKESAMVAGEVECRKAEGVGDAVDEEPPMKSTSEVVAQTEAHTDVLYPMLGIGGIEDASATETTNLIPVDTTAPALDTHAADSASEVEELTALASKHRGVLQPDERTEEWTSVTVPLSTLDQGAIVSFRPYGIAEVGLAADSLSDDTALLSENAADREAVAVSATCSPLSGIDLPLNYSEGVPDDANGQAVIDGSTYLPLRDAALPLNHIEVTADGTTPKTTRLETQTTLEQESNGLATSTPVPVHTSGELGSSSTTAFSIGSYRHLCNLLEDENHHSAIPPLDDTRNAVEFIDHVTAYQWRLSAPPASNTDFRSIPMENSTPQTDTLVTSMPTLAPDAGAAVALVDVPTETQRGVYTESKAKREQEAQRLREQNAKQAKANRKLRSRARKAAAAAASLDEVGEELISALDEVDDEHISWRSVMISGSEDDILPATQTTLESAVNAICGNPEHDDRLQLLSTSPLDINVQKGVVSTVAPVEEPTGVEDELRSSLPPAKDLHTLSPRSSDGSAPPFETSKKGDRHKWQSEGEDQVYSKRLDLRLIKSENVQLNSQIGPGPFYEELERE